MSNSGLSYCGKDIKKNDYDRYLTCLFAPEKSRENLFSLYAFNQEIAKTAEVVSEPLTGMIRLQWWRESIDGLYEGKPRKHAVIEALAKAIHDHSLGREKFDKLIDAREFDLEDENPTNLISLEDYVEKTSSTLIEIAVEITSSSENETIKQASKSMGLAWGMLGIIRAIPFHAAKNRIYLPQDLLSKYGVMKSELLELKSTSGLREVTRILTDRLCEHLQHARSYHGKLSKEAKSPLLIGTLADQYIKRLKNNDYDPFDPWLQGMQSSVSWRLMWANFR